ncbi:MAG: GSU3473 family protein [Dissulfurispiraceae bacterium]|jgi:hypothetical protein
MAFIRFKHQNGKSDIVRTFGLQTCIDQGIVKEFYRPSEKRWIDPLKDPVRKRSGAFDITTPDRRRNNKITY